MRRRHYQEPAYEHADFCLHRDIFLFFLEDIEHLLQFIKERQELKRFLVLEFEGVAKFLGSGNATARVAFAAVMLTS